MPSRLKLTVFSLALAIAGVAAEGRALQANQPSPEAKQHYAQARKLLALGEKDKALEELKTAIRLAPEFVDAHRDFLDNQRDKAESFVAQYEGYVKENPQSAVYHYLLGKAYSNANKRDKADAEFKKALELDPQFGWAALAVYNSAKRAGDSARAIELLETASRNAGDNIVLRSAVANSFIGSKMYERAAAEAERILQTDSEHFDAHTIKWQARLNLTFGADETRAEVLREIQALESAHGKDIRALAAAQSGYQMLENDEGAARAKKAILAIDPKYYERQTFSFTMGTPWGKSAKLSGANARLFSDTFRMKDEKQKLEAYRKLEQSIEDADARMYALYPAMLKSYVTLKDLGNAERVVGELVKGNAEPRMVAAQRVVLAQAYFESKTKLDTALEHAQRAIEALRQPPPKKEGDDPKAAEYVNESAKKELGRALHAQGQILLEKGMAEQAIAPLAESVKLSEQEESLFDLGRAYAKLDRKDAAVGALAKAYAYEGKRQQEAKANLQKVYDARARAKPLATFLSEEVDRHRAEVRKTAIDKALREIAKTESKEAPAFTLATLTGQQVQLADLRGKVLLLNFWATW